MEEIMKHISRLEVFILKKWIILNLIDLFKAIYVRIQLILIVCGSMYEIAVNTDLDNSESLLLEEISS